MINFTEHSRLSKGFGLLVAGLLFTGAAQAHLSLDRQKYDSIAARYKNENAVYTNVTERLVITEEGGSLSANTYVTMEKLLISDLAPGNYNTDYFAYDDFNSISDISAVAKNPTDRDYKSMKCFNFGEGGIGDQVFYSDVRIVEVYYTGLKKNSRTETRYTLENSDLHIINPCFMQQEIPVLNATYEVVAPSYVNINFVLKNMDNVKLKQEKETRGANTVYTFTATNLQPTKRYSHVPSMMYYGFPHIIPYITSYRLTGSNKDSLVLSTPADLYKYKSLFVRNLNLKTDTGIANTVAHLTADAKTQREKAATIYNWVQKNIHYVAFEKGLEGFVPRPADTVYKRKYGDCKDMTSILVAMYRKAGLDAHYAWIGTNIKPYTYEETPTPAVSNHMICALKLNGEWIFADGTHATLPFGMNRDDIQGKQAFIAIDADNYKIVPIPVVAAGNNVTIDSTHISIADYAVTGKLRTDHMGYTAWNYRLRMMYIKGEDRDKMMRKVAGRGSDKFLLNSYNISYSDDESKDMHITGDFNVDGYVTRSGKNCFVNMNLLRTFEDNRINEADRKVPYFYDYLTRTKEVVILDIPKGSKVTYLPKDAQGGMDGLWKYKISYKADKEHVILIKEYELNTLAVKEKQFADNNKMVDDLRKLYKETVVLTTK